MITEGNNAFYTRAEPRIAIVGIPDDGLLTLVNNWKVPDIAVRGCWNLVLFCVDSTHDIWEGPPLPLASIESRQPSAARKELLQHALLDRQLLVDEALKHRDKVVHIVHYIDDSSLFWLRWKKDFERLNHLCV